MHASAPPVSQRQQLGNLLRSVVKVLCVYDAPDYDQPWQTQGPTQATGSGAIIDTPCGPRVITNAHCVSNHKFVEVRRFGKASMFEAEVEWLGHECDLALLRIDDDSFFESATPIPIGSLPTLRTRVSVCGYPVGGERLSITEGIVSRIDLISYAQSNRHLLAVQIDAAINSGNSGGPVVRDGSLVGVAFQALDEAESVGYMIAPPIVRHFLKDVENGKYDGFPTLGATTQKLESRAQRSALGLPEGRRGGVLISRVIHGGSADGVLEEGDVLLAVDSTAVASDGSVKLREGERIHFRFVVSSRQIGETIPVTVWRNGQELSCVLELRGRRQLVAEQRYEAHPSYFIYGGMLLVPLTRDYLRTWGDSWWQSAPRELVTLAERGLPSAERSEVVVLQKVLADRVNRGYHDLESLVVETVDDQPVRSLAHAVELIEAGHGEQFVHLRTSCDTHVVLDRELADARHEAVLRKFGVPEDRSPDLLDED